MFEKSKKDDFFSKFKEPAGNIVIPSANSKQKGLDAKGFNLEDFVDGDQKDQNVRSQATVETVS